MADRVLVSLTLRPQVPMGAYHGLGYVCVLGAVDALQAQGAAAGIGWPFEVVDASGAVTLARVKVSAGYDEGMFARCDVLACADEACQWDSEALAAGIQARVSSWEAAVRGGRAAAGPLAPVLADYFDAVPLLGKPVQVLYPNGRVMALGTFAGIDVWGRATVRTDAGQEIEFAPEQASLTLRQGV